MEKYYFGIDKKNLRVLLIILFIILIINYNFTLGPFGWVEASKTPYLRYVLSGNALGHLSIKILIWFLSLYPLLLGVESTLQELSKKTNYILISRIGKKRYLKEEIKHNVKLPIIAISIGLIINFIVNFIMFYKVPYDVKNNIFYSINNYTMFQFNHPYFMVLLVSFILLLIVGLISIQGTLFALLFEDRKIVYASTFGLYYFFIISKFSITGILQPFDEYPLNKDLVPLIFFLIIYFIVIFVSYLLVRKKYETIY